MMMTTLTSSRINDIHKKMVFRYIWEKEQASRTQIRSHFGFSKSTVSGIIRDLIEQSLIVENGQEDAPLGRKPELLTVNPHGPMILSVLLKDLGDVEVAVVDPKGTILSRESLTLLTKEPPQAAVGEIAWFVNAALAKFPHTTCLGIGLGAPGIVNHSSGIIEYSAHFGWKGIPIGSMLSAGVAQEFPILVDNRTTAATLGEMWFGSGKNSRNLICINCGEAIGAGIVIEGKIYRGFLDGVGEIGHIPLIPNGNLCFCGKTGCVESMVSLPALMKRMGRKYTGEDDATRILRNEIGKPSIKEMTLEAYSTLGEIAVILTNILAPEKIIFTGGLTRIEPEEMLSSVQQKVQEKALEPLARNIQLELSSFHQETDPLWGASLVMENIFSLEIIR